MFRYFVQSLQAVAGEVVTTLCHIISDSSRSDNLTIQCWVTLAVGNDCEVIKTILNTDWVLCHEIVYICLTQQFGGTRLCIWNPCWNVPMLPNALLVQWITLNLEVERTIGHGWAHSWSRWRRQEPASAPAVSVLCHLVLQLVSSLEVLSLKGIHVYMCVLHDLSISSFFIDHSTNVWQGVQTVELLIMQFSLLSCFFSVLNHMEELPMSTFCFCEFLVCWMS